MPAMPTPWGLLGGAGVALLATVVAHAQTLGPTRNEELKEALSVESRAQPQKDAGKPTNVDLERRYQDLLAQAKDAQRATRTSADEVLRLADQLDQRRPALADKFQAVRENEDGRRIAVDPEKVKLFRAAMTTAEKNGPTPEEVERIRTQTKTNLSATDAALLDPASRYLPPTELRDSLARDRSLLEAKLTAMRDSENAVAALVRNAANTPPGAQTLQAALDVLEQDESLNRIKGADAQRQKDAAELNQGRRAEIEARLAEIEQARAERAANEKLANDEGIIDRFKPFLAPSKHRLNGRSYTPGAKHAHPAAYEDLEAVGALSSVEGMIRAANSSLNKRPHWSEEILAADLEKVRQDFALLKKLAPVWVEQCRLLKTVEAGKLSPVMFAARCREVYAQRREDREKKEREEETRLRGELAALP